MGGFPEQKRSEAISSLSAVLGSANIAAKDIILQVRREKLLELVKIDLRLFEHSYVQRTLPAKRNHCTFQPQ